MQKGEEYQFSVFLNCNKWKSAKCFASYEQVFV